MIPAQAVEAAAKIIYRTSGRKRVMRYEDACDACKAEALELLDAAAPHMRPMFDRGGSLAPGLTTVTNDSGAPIVMEARK